MGTNYYLLYNICATCKRAERLHIGKSSSGWCFGLQVIPENGIRDLGDWEKLFKKPDTAIENEYGKRITAEEMLDIICNRAINRPDATTLSFYPYSSLEALCTAENAIRCPNGLLRRKIDDERCIGHGSGTWDLIAGDFS